jgi:peptidoglycan/xylan/chitin deacetylase (PgdA/CDA1 family)
MNRKIKAFILKTIYCSGGYFLIRCLSSWLFDNPIRILFAHDIIDTDDDLYEIKYALGDLNVTDFVKRIEYLKRHYKFITIENALKMLKYNRNQRERNCIVLTFDDGYKSVFTRAYPILKKFNIPATVFLSTNYIRDNSQSGSTECKNIIWYDKLLHAVNTTRSRQISILDGIGPLYPISTLPQKKIFIEHTCKYLKGINEINKKEVFRNLLDRLGYFDDEYVSSTPNKNCSIMMLSWDEVKEMFGSGLVSFGCHSMSHPIMSRIPLDEARQEIIGSKAKIEEKLGIRITTFAFPNGHEEDFNGDHINLLEQLNFQGAFTTINHGNNHLNNTMRLGRDGFDNDEWYYFVLRMAGFFDIFKKFFY